MQKRKGESEDSYKERKKLYWRSYRLKYAEKYRKYIREYRKEYRKTRPDSYIEKDEQKKRARHAVENAKRRGKLMQLPCAKCGESKSQAHHLDYSKPLDVIWLCPVHHMETHNRRKSGHMSVAT